MTFFLIDETFENFRVKCGSRRDYMISTSSGNGDGQHLVEVTGLTLNNVDDDSKLFFYRPSVG